ncbi:uncharacterized protein JCM6883_002556 [Sporobolomyces salmoneus]|uniref:uncharacterized protein n=1 Tax=Sporobolomyces salmoneus TaxID=183962 RepID=UPI00316FC77D
MASESLNAGVAFLPTPPNGIAALPLWIEGVDEGLLHPTPTPHFRTRLITLFTFSAIYTVLSAAYGITSIIRTKERPRTKALWFARLVSRSSGRFIVLNPRMAWSLGGVVVGCWSIALVHYNYQAFLQDGDQAAMWGVRAMNNWVWFVIGWPVSWAGAQAYLLTDDAPKAKLPSARKANLLFLVGGFVLAAISFGFGMFQSERGRQYWFAGGALREALVEAYGASPSGTPTADQMAILRPLAARTAETWSNLKTATIIHASFSPVPVLACLIVNGLGFALVYKLHRQVRESTALMSLSNPGRFTSDDPADWRGPSATTSAPMSNLDGSTEKLPPPIAPPPRVHTDQQLTTLQNLKRAELDMAALTIFFTISTLAYTAGFILADFVMSVDAKNTWPLAEGAFGVPLWSTVIIGPVLYAFLLFNTTSNRFVSPSSFSSSPNLAGSIGAFPTAIFPTLTTEITATSPTTSKFANLVPVLRRNNSRTPMLSSGTEGDARQPASKEIRVMVQVRTDSYDEKTPPLDLEF